MKVQVFSSINETFAFKSNRKDILFNSYLETQRTIIAFRASQTLLTVVASWWQEGLLAFALKERRSRGQDTLAAATAAFLTMFGP